LSSTFKNMLEASFISYGTFSAATLVSKKDRFVKIIFDFALDVFI